MSSHVTSLPPILGLDVGSTAVKLVAVDPRTRRLLWSAYRRHEARQAETALDLLRLAGRELGPLEGAALGLTGTGAELLGVLGGRVLQEVTALQAAVEACLPGARTAVDLGGQDAKMLFFGAEAEGGPRSVLPTMNDRCGSGTGATLDRCALKLGLSPAEMASVRFEPARLHPVAARCGVFAETDIVSLLKSGVPAAELVGSLADAIVKQNLSVLARGNCLRPPVVLAGGPHAHLPVLEAAWRHRLPEHWREHALAPWPDRPLKTLVFTPAEARHLTALGAALLVVSEPAVRFAGVAGLEAQLTGRRGGRARAAEEPPLVSGPEELALFRQRYSVSGWTPPAQPPGGLVQAWLGLDGGSTSSKAVLVDEVGGLLAKAYRLSLGNPIEDAKDLVRLLRDRVEAGGARLQILGAGATGYAADVLESLLGLDANVVETVAHLESALECFGDADVVCDVGGQDIKVLFVKNGAITDFRLSTQCSAGNGMLLQAMASQFGVPLEEYAEAAFRARSVPRFSYGCGVFIDADRVHLQREGYSPDELLAGLAMVLPKNIWQHIVGIPRLAELGTRFVLQGGTQYNLAAVKAQVDYILQRVPGARVDLHPHPGEAGALGAARAARRAVARRGRSTFVGLDGVIALTYEVRNDEDTRCRFCANLCSRTFVDSRSGDGAGGRHVSGFACERGMAVDAASLRSLLEARAARAGQCPDLVAEEAAALFEAPGPLPDLPEAGTPLEEVDARPGMLGLGRPRTVRRAFERSTAAAHRASLRIGLPRVLAMYSTAPLWRGYLQTLGVPAGRIVFSGPTTDRLLRAGGRRGANDPCFPAKAALAHVHELLEHPEGLTHLFFPCVTHLPTWLDDVRDSAACCVVAGTPNVVRATLDREGTAFAGRGIAFLDPSLNLLERNLFKRQMFEVWGPSLRVTEDESDFAVEAGFDALARFDLRMQQRGREVLERAEAERRVAVLALGRPYHADPGLNHGVFEELTRLGHPVLTLRSLPRDPQWLARLFRPEAPPGLQAPPLGVSDVWPENFSANSAQKVWAAKLAARHPNLAVLHLSSFKCGHDSPTYAIVDRILNCSGTPVAALQDLDANRPTGSLKLRMRTFAYSLGLYQERLRTAVAADMAGLQARFRPVQWAEPPARPFTREERPRTRVLMGGLTPAHDQFMAAAYAALGYRTESLPPPDAAAFQLGKEYGSRGQCNPAYFTVGNLLRHLRRLCDSEGSTPRQLVEDAMFVTAGSCGPCRFGAYLTEYRKTLRDAGFEGFRVIDFAQQGWLGGSRASANPGIRQDLPFFLAFVRAALAGDVLNLVGYRIRPYETRPGATDRALAQAREWVARAMRERRSVTAALREARALLAAVETERTRPRTRVAVSGEIWAMTTEGDGNYRMHRFLESEGAEVESQPLVRWILYLMWLARHNVDRRLRLKRPDRAQAGLAGTNGRLKKLKLWLSERTVRTWFACYARAAGLEGYRLPVLDEMAAAAGSHYNVDNAGGESFMEVAETILASRHRTVHLIVSVKPFGCMPSSGVSDGIQPAVLARHPGPMFVSVETTGDAAANALSRVQTMLFAARRSAEAEFQEALDRSGFTLETFRSALRSAPGLSETLHHAPRVVAGSAANLVYELAARTPGRRGPPLSGLHPAPPGSRETRPGCAPCPDGTAGDLERAPEGLE